MLEKLSSHEIDTLKQVAKFEAIFGHLNEKLDSVLLNQGKQDEKHDRVLELVNGHDKRLSKLESDRGILGKVLFFISSSASGFVGGYFGRHT